MGLSRWDGGRLLDPEWIREMRRPCALNPAVVRGIDTAAMDGFAGHVVAAVEEQ